MDVDHQVLHHHQQAQQNSPPLPPPEGDSASPPIHPDSHAAYYPDNPSTDLTGGLPLNLDSLRDGPPGSKPFYPYSTLIRYVIGFLKKG
jgi:forkhead box protein J2/3